MIPCLLSTDHRVRVHASRRVGERGPGGERGRMWGAERKSQAIRGKHWHARISWCQPGQVQGLQPVLKPNDMCASCPMRILQAPWLTCSKCIM